MRTDLPALKETLRIPEIWKILGLPGTPGPSCRSPFRQDKTPSFSIHDEGRRWKDFGTGDRGDAIDFIATACSLEKAAALKRFCELAGAPLMRAFAPRLRKDLPAVPARAASHLRTSPPVSINPQPQPFDLPTLRRGSPANIGAVARSRGLDPAAVSLAQSLGTLAFGRVCGFHCWLLGDPGRRITEARRVDGDPFPAMGTLGGRKAHTLRGSHKNWPVGVSVLEKHPHFRAVMLVEGGPDYLAALHFALQQECYDVLPVAMLGRSTGTRIAPEALDLLAGRRVRICPHADPDGGGLTSAHTWAAQLHQHGCDVDLYELTGLHLPDGRPVKDLNEAACLPPNKRFINEYPVLP